MNPKSAAHARRSQRRVASTGPAPLVLKPRSRPAQERGAKLIKYLASTESPTYRDFLVYAGLIEDTVTSDIRAALNAAGLAETVAEPPHTVPSAEQLERIKSLPHIRALTKQPRSK
jgi:hypothetical protein